MDKTAMQRHMADIKSGEVTKTTVIGIRKAANHIARLSMGWSGNRSNATADEVAGAFDALEKLEPLVTGELHASGVRQLTDKRYAKRWTDAQRAVVTAPGLCFRLVRFDWLDSTHCTPVFRAISGTDSFLFRNVPWQSGGNGPEVVT